MIRLLHHPFNTSGFDHNLPDFIEKLDEHEQQRYHRFKNGLAQRTYLQSRKILKQSLAELLHVPAEQIRFDYSDNGKPFLRAGTSSQPLHFSVAHSRNDIVIAIADHNVGVDVEDCERSTRLIDDAENLINGDVAQNIKHLAPGQACDVFCQYWTVLEAQVKFNDSSIFTERDGLTLTRPVAFTHYQDSVPPLARASFSIDQRARLGIVAPINTPLTFTLQPWQG